MIEKLKQYMEENNLNQKQLASLLSITEGHLSKVLAGKKKPGAKTVEQYMKLPGVREREAIREVRELIDDLWLAGEIEMRPAKKILTKLNK